MCPQAMLKVACAICKRLKGCFHFAFNSAAA
jgi:hypothetical protein